MTPGAVNSWRLQNETVAAVVLILSLDSNVGYKQSVETCAKQLLETVIYSELLSSTEFLFQEVFTAMQWQSPKRQERTWTVRVYITLLYKPAFARSLARLLTHSRTHSFSFCVHFFSNANPHISSITNFVNTPSHKLFETTSAKSIRNDV